MEIDQTLATGNKSRHKKIGNPKVDMTPMVDLGFLLITFFIFTTTISTPSVTPLVVPKDGPPMALKESRSLNVLLGPNNQAFVYEGRWEDAVKHQNILPSNYDIKNGIGQVIRNKQSKMLQEGKDKDKLVLLIKPLETSSYKNLIDALDEVMINNVQYYAVNDPSEEEIAYVSRY